MKKRFAIPLVVLGALAGVFVVRSNIATKRSGIVLSGYHQFYIADRDSDSDTGSDDFWTKEAYDIRVATHPDLIGIRTSSTTVVPVSIKLEKVPSAFVLGDEAYAIEAPIKVRNGRLSVLGCPEHDPGVGVDLPNGDYRVRVFFSKLVDDGSELWWEGDSYSIVVVPGLAERVTSLPARN